MAGKITNQLEFDTPKEMVFLKILLKRKMIMDLSASAYSKMKTENCYFALISFTIASMCSCH